MKLVANVILYALSTFLIVSTLNQLSLCKSHKMSQMKIPTSLPGLEIYFDSIQNRIESKHDACAALIHYIIIHQGFKCVGTNEKLPDISDSTSGSEKLPAQWKARSTSYTMQYVHQVHKTIMLVKLVKAESELVVNALINPEEHVITFIVDTEKYFSDNFREFDTMFKPNVTLATFLAYVYKEFINKLASNEDSNNEKQRPSTSRTEQRRPEAEQPRPEVPAYPSLMVRPNNPEMMFPQIGGADLDPLGRGIGGGMLMDPRQFERVRLDRPSINPGLRFDPSSGLDRSLPPGAVPPGARFEYIGPPRPRRPNRNPHPDMEHIPDYDDMFM